MNNLIRRAALMLSTVALLALPLMATDTRTRAAAPAPPTAKPRFSPNQVEAYATASDLAFIRPGLKIIVTRSPSAPIASRSLTST